MEERPFEGRVKKHEKEINSTLPKAVAGEQTSQATGATTNLAVFRAFVKAGQRLAEIHVHYEQQPEYKLTQTEKTGEKLDYRVTKMKLSKDKATLIYNQFLTLSAIPKETYEYRLVTAPPSNGSSINIRSRLTNVAASPTTLIDKTIRNTFFV